MSKEIFLSDLTAGSTYFARIRNPAGLVWTGAGNTFAAASTITWATAGLPLAADATITTDFSVDFPATITTAGKYRVTIHEQAGASPALSDVLAGSVGGGDVNWTGTAEASAQTLTTAERQAVADAFLERSAYGRSLKVKQVLEILAGQFGGGAAGGVIRNFEDDKDLLVYANDNGVRTIEDVNLTP